MAGRIARQALRRQTVNTPGFTQPERVAPKIAPDAVERNEPNPRMTEAPPIQSYALRPIEKFGLVTAVPDAPRPVLEADLPELFEWGLPLFEKRFPAASIDSMLPLVRLAIRGFPYHVLRTDDAFGVFQANQMPWHAAPVVFDHFIAWREPTLIHQAVLICRAAREWAKSIRASEFQLIECDENLEALASRLGLKDFTRNYSHKL